MCGVADKATFPCNADRCERVITGDHPAREVSRSQRENCRCRPRFEFVLEDDQSKEAKVALSLFTETKLERVS